MGECSSIWKKSWHYGNNLSEQHMRYWVAERVARFAIFSLHLKSSWLLRSAFSLPARAKIPTHRYTDIIKLPLSVIFYSVSLGFSQITMPKPHFRYSECSMFAVSYSYFSSLPSMFGKPWFFWNLKCSECASQIANVFADNLGQVWSILVAAVSFNKAERKK